MPMGCGREAARFGLAAGPELGVEFALEDIWPPRYCGGRLGEVAEVTADGESYARPTYDRAEGLGDRGYGLCDAAAMVLEFKSLFPAA